MEGIKTGADYERRKLLEEIQMARNKALPFEEIQAMKDEHNRAVKEFLNGEVSHEIMQEEIDALDDQAGVIQKKGLIEFMELLRAIGLKEEEVRKITSHENDHLTEALSHGAEPLYQVQFMTRINESKTQMGIYPSVAVYWPEDVSEEERREALKSIIDAPEVLSPSDKAKLGREFIS